MKNKEIITYEKPAVLGSPHMPQTIDDKMQLSTILFTSRLCPRDMDSVEKVFVALQYGHELGLSPMISVQNIGIINGRPTLMTTIMKGLAFNTKTLVDYKEEKIIVNDIHVGYKITGKRNDNGFEFQSSFTLEDAQKAGLMNRDTYKKYPLDMILYRAESRFLRKAYPELFAGLYTPDEAADFRDVTPEKAPVSLDNIELPEIDIDDVKKIEIIEDEAEKKIEPAAKKAAKKSDKKEEVKSQPKCETSQESPEFNMPFEPSESLTLTLKEARLLKPHMSTDDMKHFQSVSQAGPEAYTLEQYEFDTEMLKDIKSRSKKDKNQGGLFDAKK
jgi:hypothetical protein